MELPQVIFGSKNNVPFNSGLWASNFLTEILETTILLYLNYLKILYVSGSLKHLKINVFKKISKKKGFKENKR